MNQTLTLEKMSESEYKEYIEKTTLNFAKQLQITTKTSLDDCIAETREKVAKSAPEGLRTQGLHCLNILLDQHKIGIARFHISKSKQAFVYDFEINPEHAGHGFYAIQALKRYIQNLGCNNVGLHVFANNERAKKLYLALGFKITSYNMSIEF